MPYDTRIDANDQQEAEDKLMEEYYKDDSLTFTVDVSVQPGEKLRRPLKYFRDQGNAFDLKISYEYYEAYVIEGDMMDTGQGSVDDSGNNVPPAYLGMLVQIGANRW